MLKDRDLPPYKPIPKHKPDWLTYAVRFVCGAALGFILGCMTAVGAIRIIFSSNRYGGFAAMKHGEIYNYEPTLYAVCGVAILFFILSFGLGAAILGDRFWPQSKT